jgi:hypothetical protein
MRIAPVVLLAFCFAVPAQAMRAFHWETDTGTLAYADAKDRVPSRYLDRAKLIDVPALRDYARLTISQHSLRAPGAAVAAAVPAAPAPEAPEIGTPLISPVIAAPQTILVQAGNGVMIPVPAAGLDPTAPIRVEKRVYRWEDGLAYPFTIVKQGDRVLVEIREEL